MSIPCTEDNIRITLNKTVQENNFKHIDFFTKKFKLTPALDTAISNLISEVHFNNDTEANSFLLKLKEITINHQGEKIKAAIETIENSLSQPNYLAINISIKQYKKRL